MLVINTLFQESQVTGRKADVIMAAHNAAEVALRMVKPGAEVRISLLDACCEIYRNGNMKQIKTCI